MQVALRFHVQGRVLRVSVTLPFTVSPGFRLAAALRNHVSLSHSADEMKSLCRVRPICDADTSLGAASLSISPRTWEATIHAAATHTLSACALPPESPQSTPRPPKLPKAPQIPSLRGRQWGSALGPC